MTASLVIGLNAVIAAVTREQPLILVVDLGGDHAEGSSRGVALPFGPLDPTGDRTLELGLRGWVREQTGLELGYVEQLYTFGDSDRHLPEAGADARVISVAYLTLVREQQPAPESDASWMRAYDFLPWEDWRAGRPPVIDRAIAPALRSWSEETLHLRRERGERVEIAFGLGGMGWDEERVLDRYELLYEARLIPEARRRPRTPEATCDRRGTSEARSPKLPGLGHTMVLDHRRILATALGRLRGKLKYRPVVFELLPPVFTLLQLQRVVEALSGIRLHKQNFRRLVEKGGLVEGTGTIDRQTGGRPAELFTFRREVLRERPAPGVGLPGLKGEV